MFKRLKSILLNTMAVALLLTSAMPAIVSAQEDNIGNNLCNGANLSLDPNAPCTSDATAAQDTVDRIIKLVINIFSLLVGVISVIMIIVGGLKYITSGGEGTNIQGAKNTILYAIIGLVVVALAQVIVRFVLSKATIQ